MTTGNLRIATGVYRLKTFPEPLTAIADAVMTHALGCSRIQQEVEMRVLIPLVLAASSICLAGSNVLIFNYDQVDLVYDAVVGDSIDTGYWVEQTLLALGDTVDSGTTLPSDLSSYDAVFMMMGMYTC